MASERPVRRVLCIGSSTVRYPEDRPALSQPGLLQAQLERDQPDQVWEVRTAVLYPFENMA